MAYQISDLTQATASESSLASREMELGGLGLGARRLSLNNLRAALLLGSAALGFSVSDPLVAGAATLGAVSATSFAGEGSAITALNATQLTSGTIPNARFPATLPVASGVNLTALNATNLASGTVADGRLSSNVPLKDAANTWTATQAFAAFTGTTSTLTTSLAIGTNPATAGIIALANNLYIQYRNAANSANARVLGFDSSNGVRIDVDSFGTTFGGQVIVAGAFKPATTVIVGTDPGGAELLRVGGAMRVSGALTSITAGSATINNAVASNSTTYWELSINAGVSYNRFGVDQAAGNAYYQAANGIDFYTGGALHLQLASGGALSVTSTISTADPGSGIGLWLLGKFQTAVVTLDTAHYVETKIDGTVRKLALVT